MNSCDAIKSFGRALARGYSTDLQYLLLQPPNTAVPRFDQGCRMRTSVSLTPNVVAHANLWYRKDDHFSLEYAVASVAG
jgi:hypothetical protein